MGHTTIKKLALCVFLACANQAYAQTQDEHKSGGENDAAIEEITVIGKSVSYANNASSEEMIKQQSAMTSALAVIDNLPGVLINEGDTFGTDDWSTTVSIRGFQLSLDEQQIGITVDGIANGNSNYGGGAKANRYIDTENLHGVDVSQGTADIASRSNEALGGTLNFTTIDPTEASAMTVSASAGNADAQKFFVRYNTGEIFNNTYMWLSASSASNSDWIQGAAENTRDHFAAKLKSMINDIEITGYASYDDVHEDNYQRVSKAQFDANPSWDRLTKDWTGIPYIDQAYRRGWSTLRENLFGYLQADYKVDNLELRGNVYYHDNEGRGDWVPQYIVNVKDDGVGNPHSELVSGNTVYGGSPSAVIENAIFILPHNDPKDPNNSGNSAWGQIGYVDRDGRSIAVQSIQGCASLTFPYGGSRNDDPSTPNNNESANLHLDPACFPRSAVPVGSYRHTHYAKERIGFNGDFTFYSNFSNGMQNELRGGFWYEDYQRDEYRDWHKIIDSRVSFKFDEIPYWRQYDNRFNVETTMLYMEDELDMNGVRVRVGAKKFIVDLEKKDRFNSANNTSVDSDSDILFSAGVVADVTEDLEVFAGYAQNFAAIKDTVLERDASSLTELKPETADNIDLGLRYASDWLDASLTYYTIEFENRLTFIAPDSPDGINYTIGTNGSYINVGGIDSKGFEASASAYLSDEFTLYASFTSNDSTYVGGVANYPAGNTVAGSAESLFVLSLDWVRNQYFAGVSSKWVGDRWIDAKNTTKADAYTMVDLYAGVSLESPFEGIEMIDIRLTINNLTDESYLAGISGGSAWIGAPRTAAINMTATF